MSIAAKAYLATQVETTSQGELLLMLYEACIKFLKRARLEIEAKNYAQKGIYISKALAIIHELAESLNKNKGGEVSERLSQLYIFCTMHLTKANIHMDVKKVEEVIRIMDSLRSAYAEIVPKFDKEQGLNGANVTAQRNPNATPQMTVTENTAPAPPPASKQATVTSTNAEPPVQPEAKATSKPKAPAKSANPASPAAQPSAPVNPALLRARNAYINANK